MLYRFKAVLGPGRVFLESKKQLSLQLAMNEKATFKDPYMTLADLAEMTSFGPEWRGCWKSRPKPRVFSRLGRKASFQQKRWVKWLSARDPAR